jgi:hypothetical protein
MHRSRHPSCVLRVVVLALGAVVPFLAAAEVFVDVGANVTRVRADVATLPLETSRASGWHVGTGVRRASQHGSFGVRLELDDVDGDTLLSVRALDYRHLIKGRLAVSAFLGASRLDLATPAFGYYLGGGLTLRDLFPRWDLTLDLRYGDKIARDNLLPSDPQGGRPDNFYDLSGASLYFSRRF